MLLVMMICGTKPLPPFAFPFVICEFFHFSSSGKKANVSQYGPTAFTLYESVKLSSGTSSNSA
jgi:hypothetical protein